MFLIIGLGNPGGEYAHTRHNVGFMAADALASHYNFSLFKSKFDGLIAEGKIGNDKVFILKPQTYMNLSGNSAVKAAMFYKILPQNIIVIHDDIDLKVGHIKAKTGGGTGGHNGLKSLDSHITKDYNRIRIGVGGVSREETINHVLSGFSKSDEKIINDSIEIIVKNINILLEQGIDKFSNILGMEIKNGI